MAARRRCPHCYRPIDIDLAIHEVVCEALKAQKPKPREPNVTERKKEDAE